jgi:exonuclease SbcD
VDRKQVILLELDKAGFNIKPIEIPAFRRLVRLEGTLDAVREELEHYTSTTQLQDLIELHVTEENESIGIVQDLLDLSEQDYGEDYKVVGYKLIFKNVIAGTSSFLNKSDHISNYTPLDMFKKLIEQDAKHAEDVELLNAFKEALEIALVGNVLIDNSSEEL